MTVVRSDEELNKYAENKAIVQEVKAKYSKELV